MRTACGLIIAFLGLSEASPITLGSGGSCKEFVVDKCIDSSTDDNGIFEIGVTDTVAKCQLFCNLIYPNQCTFFIYDFRQRECQLWETPLDDYLATCKKVAGPLTPNLDDCKPKSQVDECDVSSLEN